MSGLSPMLRQMPQAPIYKIKRIKKQLKQNFFLANPNIAISNTDIYNVILRSITNNPNLCVYNNTIPIFTQYYYDKNDENEEPVELNNSSNTLEYTNFKKKYLKYKSSTKLGKKFKEFQRNYGRIWGNFFYFYEDCKGSVIVLPLVLYFYDKDEKGKLYYVGTHNTTLLIDKISKIAVYLDSTKSFPKKGKTINQPVNYNTKYFKDLTQKLYTIQNDLLGKSFPMRLFPLPTPNFISTQRLHSLWTLFLTDLILRYYGQEVEYGKIKNIDIRATLDSLFQKYNEYRLSIIFNQYMSYLLKVKENYIPPTVSEKIEDKFYEILAKIKLK
jgi:hypothetical protein